jgi:cytochrome oxidase Cu insertion factor (SCO1/SenC/PrrC family)
VVGVLSAGVLGTSLWIRGLRQKTFQPEEFVEVGKEVAEDFGSIENDLELVNQDGETVALSELKEKVWVATNFFAACPNCLATSSQDLKKLYEEFRGNPDFHVVSITVNPAEDTVEKLKMYADALEADTRNWWFLRGPAEAVHEYVEKEMKFMKVFKNPPEASQAYSHDYGIQVYARDWKRVKKRDLHYARAQSEVAHDAFYEEVREAIEKSLAAKAGGTESEPKGP